MPGPPQGNARRRLYALTDSESPYPIRVPRAAQGWRATNHAILAARVANFGRLLKALPRRFDARLRMDYFKRLVVSVVRSHLTVTYPYPPRAWTRDQLRATIREGTSRGDPRTRVTSPRFPG